MRAYRLTVQRHFAIGHHRLEDDIYARSFHAFGNPEHMPVNPQFVRRRFVAVPLVPALQVVAILQLAESLRFPAARHGDGRRLPAIKGEFPSYGIVASMPAQVDAFRVKASAPMSRRRGEQERERKHSAKGRDHLHVKHASPSRPLHLPVTTRPAWCSPSCRSAGSLGRHREFRD